MIDRHDRQETVQRYQRAVRAYAQAVHTYLAARTQVEAARRSSLLGRAALQASASEPPVSQPLPPIPPALARLRAIPDRPPRPDDANLLTPRQREVAALIASGHTNAEIAERLVVTEGTTANHVAAILERLGLTRRSQIAVWAVQHGLIGDGRSAA